MCETLRNRIEEASIAQISKPCSLHVQTLDYSMINGVKNLLNTKHLKIKHGHNKIHKSAKLVDVKLKPLEVEAICI